MHRCKQGLLQDLTFEKPVQSRAIDSTCTGPASSLKMKNSYLLFLALATLATAAPVPDALAAPEPMPMPAPVGLPCSLEKRSTANRRPPISLTFQAPPLPKAFLLALGSPLRVLPPDIPVIYFPTGAPSMERVIRVKSSLSGMVLV